MSASARALVDAARSLHRSGMNSGTAGNFSQRAGEGMLITPSAVDYERLQAEDMVNLALDGRLLEPGSAKVPSSEWRFHAVVYEQYEEAGAVVHAHSTYATSLACMGRGIPAFHYEVALAGGHNVRCAPYATFGTAQLADNLREALIGRRACLLANHGLVVWSEKLAAAVALAQKVEHLAQIYCQCLAVGEPELLAADEMERVVEKYRSYGTPAAH